MIRFFQIFFISQNTEILIELSFGLGMYIRAIHPWRNNGGLQDWVGDSHDFILICAIEPSQRFVKFQFSK